MAVSWLQDIYFLSTLILAGICAGYLAGLFGIGGGGIIVPVLATIFPYFGLDAAMDMHCAVGTSLALIAPGALSASLRHFSQGSLDPASRWPLWLVAVTAGVILGTLILSRVESGYVKIVFALYMYVVAISLYLKKSTQVKLKRQFPRPTTQLGVGLCVGSLSSVLGLGGGSFTVPFYNQYNLPLKMSIALGSVTGIAIGSVGALGAIINGWGLMGRPAMSLGYVNIPALIIMAPLMMLCAPRGASMSYRLPSKKLKLLCISFYFIMGLYMTFKIFL